MFRCIRLPGIAQCMHIAYVLVQNVLMHQHCAVSAAKCTDLLTYKGHVVTLALDVNVASAAPLTALLLVILLK
jgi:hypothetical protein